MEYFVYIYILSFKQDFFFTFDNSDVGIEMKFSTLSLSTFTIVYLCFIFFVSNFFSFFFLENESDLKGQTNVAKICRKCLTQYSLDAITSAYRLIMKDSPRDFVFLDLINMLTEVK